jgi:catechol 2,3-dioxygenase-like lactoylglutathione lyase family enzyme
VLAPKTGAGVRLRSVILTVGDWSMVERCRDWYAGHVGLASSRELTGESSWLAAGDVELGLHTGPAAETPAVTLSFVVADVDTEVERLRADGVDIADPEDKPWGARAATTRDPAGNEVILMTPHR